MIVDWLQQIHLDMDPGLQDRQANLLREGTGCYRNNLYCSWWAKLPNTDVVSGSLEHCYIRRKHQWYGIVVPIVKVFNVEFGDITVAWAGNLHGWLNMKLNLHADLNLRLVEQSVVYGQNKSTSISKPYKYSKNEINFAYYVLEWLYALFLSLQATLQLIYIK